MVIPKAGSETGVDLTNFFWLIVHQSILDSSRSEDTPGLWAGFRHVPGVCQLVHLVVRGTSGKGTCVHQSAKSLGQQDPRFYKTFSWLKIHIYH